MSNEINFENEDSFLNKNSEDIKFTSEGAPMTDKRYIENR